VEGLLLVLRLFGTNSLMTNSSLSQILLEFSMMLGFFPGIIEWPQDPASVA